MRPFTIDIILGCYLITVAIIHCFVASWYSAAEKEPPNYLLVMVVGSLVGTWTVTLLGSSDPLATGHIFGVTANLVGIGFHVCYVRKARQGPKEF